MKRKSPVKFSDETHAKVFQLFRQTGDIPAIAKKFHCSVVTISRSIEKSFIARGNKIAAR